MGVTIDVGGCTIFDTSTIYLTYEMEYINFPHEVIHWATSIGNEGHGSIYFTQCEKSGIVSPFLH
jgi:hypothetical protein